MYAATTSVALVGGTVRPVMVEAHVGRQQDVFKLSGLPDTAVREAKDRVRAAVASTGMRFPNRTITVNLAPADMPKGGTDYDLPIALGILGASREAPPPTGVIVVGELALDGVVRPAANALGAGVLSARRNLPCMLARESTGEAAAIPGSRVYGIGSLAEAVDLLRTGFENVTPAEPREPDIDHGVLDLSDIKGQGTARRALEVSAAGGHHLLLHGPPGGGKTMLAQRLPGLFPPLDPEEAVEVALLWAAAGHSRGIHEPPPFRSPHHTASRAALVGGGSGIPRPGEVSLAHRGVLFLDELAEHPRSHLDSLRQPIEEGFVTISRMQASVRFPASFQLIGATNPCPCGFFGDQRRPCECRPAARERYRARISGPLIDRFDMVVRVGRLDAAAYDGPPGESSDAVRHRVVEARSLQLERGGLNRSGPLDRMEIAKSGRLMLKLALTKEIVTARGADRLHRVARTIADLEAAPVVEDSHVAEAIGMRSDWRES